MAIVAQFYPNGEFTHGYDSSRARKTAGERKVEKIHSSKNPQEVSEVCADISKSISAQMSFEGKTFQSQYALYTCLRRHGESWFYAVEPHEEGIEPYVVESEHSPPRYSYLVGAFVPLGLSDGTKFTASAKTKNPCTGLTRSMARTIRNAGFILEEAYGKDNLSFLTLTLPDLPPDGLQACAENWGRMVDQFLKWLRDRIETKGGTLNYTYCTEVQTKRLEKRGEYALHLHLLFGGRTNRKSAWYVQPSQVRAAWVRCIKAVYPGLFKSDALENLQRIRRSAAGYIAKYVSKGTQGNTPRRNDGSIPWFSGHWGGVSRAVRQSITRGCRKLVEGVSSGETTRAFVLYVGRLSSRGLIKFYASGFIQTDRHKNDKYARGIHVGVGCLKRTLDSVGKDNLEVYIYGLIAQLESEELLTDT